MTRRLFDLVVSSVGVTVALVILASAGLVLWGSTFVGGQVEDQLSAQKIFFPPANSEALPASEYPDLQQYGGQQVLNGDQAKAYGDGYIGSHLTGIAGGKTYSEVSSLSRANPEDQELRGQVESLFRGTTLRGMLLNAYAFGQMAEIMGIIAIVLFAGGGVLTVLAGLGYWHAARVKAAQASVLQAETERREAVA